jgi:prepilin-type N-terminal cleavage/methylation domain
MKKQNNRGFTLVEIIVVLVILAILAALLVPSLTGYIDRAGSQALIAETRLVVMAVQTLASESYAATGRVDTDRFRVSLSGDTATAVELRRLSEQDTGEVTAVTFNGTAVASLTLAKGGRSCTYSSETGIYSIH